MQDSMFGNTSIDGSTFNGLLAPFDYTSRTRVVFGAGAVSRLGEFAGELNARRAFLVTDRGLRDAGHERRGVESLQSAGLHVIVFDETTTNPTTDDVDRALKVANRANVDLIVGLGGGSSMDCAKGVNFLLTNGGRMQDYWGVGKATRPMLPMIAVPTTAGTGSEAQSFALIADAKTHVKMACGDKKAACAVAVLDPELTVSMPATVTRDSGIDALSHALETYVTKPRNAISQLFSRQAWKLLARAFPEVLRNPEGMPGRSAMLLGAHLAGGAIENSMLGAVHALANPLTAHFGTVHGEAIGIMLPHVIRYNAQAVGGLYGRLAQDIGLCETNDPDAGSLLAAFVRRLVRASGAPMSLQAIDVKPELIPMLAAEASKQWTGTFNPRPVDLSSFEELYRCALTDENS